jgi:disulfide bond formation protein DsbB
MHRYVLPIALLGSCFSLYHYLLIKTDWLPSPPCLDGIPCTVDYLNWLGFINIPFLALTAFLLISLLMAVRLLVPTDQDLLEDSAIGEETAPAERPAPSRLAGLGWSDAAVFAIIIAVVTAFVVAGR